MWLTFLKAYISIVSFIFTGYSTVYSQELPNLSDSILIQKSNCQGLYTLINFNDTLLKYYYPDSTVMALGSVFKGHKNGRWQSFYADGNIHTNGYVTDSSFYGKWKFYYPNGSIKAKGEFKYMVNPCDSMLMVLIPNGKWKYWSENGKLLTKRYYSTQLHVNQSKYGNYIEKYPNGKTKVKGKYFKGQKVGVWVYYHENGMKAKEEIYQYNADWAAIHKDYPIGVWYFWNENGKLIKKETYKNGIKQ